MPSFTYDGFQIAFEQRGPRMAGRPIVLVHGLLFPRTHHYPLADAIGERGNRVILIDLLGHGESDKPKHSRHYSMEIFGRQVVALLDYLDISEAVIGGTSLGANVTLEAAAHAPERCKALVIEMPVLERAAPAGGAIFLPLTIAYARDILHPFSDSEALAGELQNCELVQSNSFLELLFPPNRLSDKI